MAAATVVFLWSVLVAWKVPAVLRQFTGTGMSARLGIAVWLTAMVCVLASAGISLALLISAAVAGWGRAATDICRSVAGDACTPVIYRSMLFEAGLAVAAALASGAAIALAWRYGRRLEQARRQTRAHAETAQLTGRHQAAGPGTVVLDVPQLAAYCLPQGIIVVTAGALSILAPAQLGAVLAHERAHLAGRHHLLVALTKALAAVFPAVPLFARGLGEVERLAEMRADDAAARQTGRGPLIEALLTMGTGAAVRAPALGAASCAVVARVERLLEPPRRAARVRSGLALGAVLVVLPLLSGLVVAFS